MIGLILGGLAIAYCILDEEEGSQTMKGGEKENDIKKHGKTVGDSDSRDNSGQQYTNGKRNNRSRSIDQGSKQDTKKAESGKEKPKSCKRSVREVGKKPACSKKKGGKVGNGNKKKDQTSTK